MEYKIKKTKAFSQDYTRLIKENLLDREDLRETISLLKETGELPLEYKTHTLRKDFSQTYDSHLDDDMILLWRKNRNVITFIRIGTHSDLF